MPRIYSPIVPGSTDESRWPVKAHSLTSHQRGVPITELPEIWGESASTTPVTATIGVDGGATAAQIGDPVDYTKDAIHIRWSRSGTLLYALVLGVYDVQRVPERGAGDTLTDADSLPLGDNIAGDNVGFRIGRKAGNQLLIQQDENADITLAQNDEIQVYFSTYDSGVLGGKFRKFTIPTDYVIWLKIRSASQPSAPTGVTYSGAIVALPTAVTNAGWVLLNAPDPTGVDPIWYARAVATYVHASSTWTVGAFTVLSFPNDRDELALELTFSATRTGTRHAAPQVDADMFAHFRLNPNDPIQTVQIREETPSPWTYPTTVVRWTPTSTNTSLDYNLVTPTIVDDYAFMLLNIRTHPQGGRSSFPIIIPTNTLFPVSATATSWQDTVSFIVAVNTSGISHLRIDDEQPSPSWNGFSFYPFRNITDDLRLLRGLRLFNPTDTSGSKGMTFTIAFH